MSEDTFIRRKTRSLLETLALLGGLALVLGSLGWILAGGPGAAWTALTGTASLLLTPRISPGLLLKFYGAMPLSPATAPELHGLARILARRAGLDRPPRISYIPNGTLNALAVGRRDDAVIAVTDGLLERMEWRELAGVLAHEISHVRNDDMRVMALADIVTRFTVTLSLFGQLLLMLNLPPVLLGKAAVPWLPILLLILAPVVSTLLQMALSRIREYDADLDAVRLTGDPVGMITALQKLDGGPHRLLGRLLRPLPATPERPLLRTHPTATERVRRLMDLLPAAAAPPPSPWPHEPAPRNGRRRAIDVALRDPPGP